MRSSLALSVTSRRREHPESSRSISGSPETKFHLSSYELRLNSARSQLPLPTWEHSKAKSCNLFSLTVTRRSWALAKPHSRRAMPFSPVLSTRPTIHGPYKASESAADTTGTFTADVLEPTRIQAAFSYRRTDAIRFAGMDASLREALSSGLREGLDKELIDQIVVDVARTNASAIDTFASYRSRFVYALIDGRFANMETDIRLLMGSATLTDAAVLYRGNTADDSAVDSLRRISGGLRVSPNIAAVSGNKQDVIVRKGLRDDVHIGLWAGIEILDDQLTKVATGEVILTAVLLAAWKITRAAGFARIQAQHA